MRLASDVAHTAVMSDLPVSDVPDRPATWENEVVGEATELVGKALHNEQAEQEGEDRKHIAHEVHERYEQEHGHHHP
jgi:uncharacterized protein YjbJ (UPF0337 family)